MAVWLALVAKSMALMSIYAISCICHRKWDTGNQLWYLAPLTVFRCKYSYIFSVDLHFRVFALMKVCVMSDLTENGEPQRCMKCTHGAGYAHLSVPLTHRHTHTHTQVLFQKKKIAICHFWGWNKVMPYTNETAELVLPWGAILKDSLKSFN